MQDAIFTHSEIFSLLSAQLTNDLLWMKVMMRCFVGGPVTSVTYIGVTRGHSRL